MQNDSNRPTDPIPLGKGVFRPSQAAIAREMEVRLKLGGREAKQRPARATGPRHTIAP
jgi:hypothetical protein